VSAARAVILTAINASRSAKPAFSGRVAAPAARAARSRSPLSCDRRFGTRAPSGPRSTPGVFRRCHAADRRSRKRRRRASQNQPRGPKRANVLVRIRSASRRSSTDHHRLGSPCRRIVVRSASCYKPAHGRPSMADIIDRLRRMLDSSRSPPYFRIVKPLPWRSRASRE